MTSAEVIGQALPPAPIMFDSKIQPSDMQWRAIKAVAEWFNTWRDTGKQFFFLAGYAGTGKTEIAKFIIQYLKIQAQEVKGMAFTGKAALMMQVRGFPFCGTIHSSIYTPIIKGKGRVPELEELIRKLKADGAPQTLIEAAEKQLKDELNGLRRLSFDLNLESDVRHLKLIVVDEGSMVGAEVGRDLLSFGVPVLVLGDPAQLPPVADGGFFTEDDPDFLLTEIHRQAADSAIIRMATMARTEGYIKPGVYSDPSGFDSIVTTGRSDADRLLNANMIICGKNETRHRVNAWLRGMRGFKGMVPNDKEKIICLKNRAEFGLLNGAFYTMQEDAIIVDDESCIVKIVSDDFPEMGEKQLTAHSLLFGGDPKIIKPWEWNERCAFDFGQCITGHKSQGSQWPHVAINAEWSIPQTWRQWLYTVVTRAQLSNYIVMPA